MNYHSISKQVAEEINLPVKVVESAYKSYWQFIKDSIQSLPLKEDLSEEEFNNMRTNFNIPSLGKLSCTYDKMINIKKRFEYIKNIRK